MFMDYMDYVDDAAMFMFTQGQAARMNATLAGPAQEARGGLTGRARAPRGPLGPLPRGGQRRRAGLPPAGYAFPPSRGREAIELHPDGSYAGSVPGPVDKPEATEGEWTLEDGSRLRLGDRVLEITEAAGDVLKVRRA